MADITEEIPIFEANEQPLLTDIVNYSLYTDNYHIKLNSVLPSINTWATQANALRDEVNALRDTTITNATKAENAATIAIGQANYKGDWIPNFETTGYNLNYSVSYTDGFNYVSKINNNLVEPTSKTNTAEWNFIEAVDLDDYYDKTATDNLLNDKADKATTYTKTESNTLLDDKANTADLGTSAGKDVYPSTATTVLGEGAFGLGKTSSIINIDNLNYNSFFSNNSESPTAGNAWGVNIVSNDNIYNGQIAFSSAAGVRTEWIRTMHAGTWGDWNMLYHTGNTTVDGNGFIKQASPIINLYTDKTEISGFDNYKTKPTMERIEKGVYKILNTQGLSSKGWYIETPKNRNSDVYFNVDYIQNKKQNVNVVDEEIEDIEVVIKVYERIWNKDTGYFENGELIDINDMQSRQISLRFNDVKAEVIEEQEQEISEDE